MTYLNIAGYQFVDLSTEFIADLQILLKKKAAQDGIKGTILLSTEGINLFLAGIENTAQQWMDDLRRFPEFSGLTFKLSRSNHLPFKKMIVRIKPEIISMYQSHIRPTQKTAPYLEPEQLKQWYDQHKDMIVLDTRNDYEFERGTFAHAIQLNIQQFSDFPKAVEKLSDEMKKKPIVTFCTGGIRCEKAAAYLLEQGFSEVWQLKGGILNYFETCKAEYFHGDCLVFDGRVAVNTNLAAVVDSATDAKYTVASLRK